MNRTYSLTEGNILSSLIKFALPVFFALLLIAIFDMGASGVAVATVTAQAVSVMISLLIIKARRLPFTFSLSHIKFDIRIITMQLLGTTIVLHDFLVGISFLVIQTVVNTFRVVASAGVEVAEKVCVFLMLVPSSYMQSMSAFTAQNMRAGNPVRAKKALFYGILQRM